MSDDRDGGGGNGRASRGGGRRGGVARPALTRARIVAEGVVAADEAGLAAVTMRSIGARLGVEGMSLYKHVANKADLLGGMVDAVLEEVDAGADGRTAPVGGVAPDGGVGGARVSASDGADGASSADRAAPEPAWARALRARALGLRDALRRHPWAIGLLDSRREPSETVIRQLDAVLGALLDGGFPQSAAVRAVSAVDSFASGHVLQERSLPFETAEDFGDVAGALLGGIDAERYPALAAVTADRLAAASSSLEQDFDADFEFGLEALIAGLARAAAPPGPR